MRVVNGDGLDLLRNLPRKSIGLVFTSPPYNIGSKAKRNDGRRSKGEYDPKSYGGITGYSDSLPEADYQKQQVKMLSAMARVLTDDGVVVYNHKPRRRSGRMIHPMEWIGRVSRLTLMEEVIWDRGSTHNHCPQLLWPHTERLYVLRRTDGKYRLRNTADMQFRSDLWRIPLVTNPALGHAAPYPLTLAASVMDAYARAGETVCDPYSGSGTTAIAALNAGCDFIGAELDPEYHAASLVRIQQETQHAVAGPSVPEVQEHPHAA